MFEPEYRRSKMQPELSVEFRSELSRRLANDLMDVLEEFDGKGLQLYAGEKLGGCDVVRVIASRPGDQLALTRERSASFEPGTPKHEIRRRIEEIRDAAKNGKRHSADEAKDLAKETAKAASFFQRSLAAAGLGRMTVVNVEDF